jgi:hypothetical protein
MREGEGECDNLFADVLAELTWDGFTLGFRFKNLGVEETLHGSYRRKVGLMLED